MTTRVPTEASWKSRVDWKGLSDFNRRRGHELIERAHHYWAQQIAAGRRPDMFHVRRLLREAALCLGIADVHLEEAINNPPGQVIDEPQPYTPPKKITTGGTVASIEEVKAGIAQATSKGSDVQAALEKAKGDIEEMTNMFQKATEGSAQSDVSEATSLLQQALENINNAQQGVQSAIQSAEGVAARL